MGSAAADYSRLFLCEETCWVNLIIVGQPYSSPALRAQYSVARTRRFTTPPARQSFAQSAGGGLQRRRRRTVFTAQCCSAGRSNTTHSSCYPNRSKSLKFYSEIISLTKILCKILTFDDLLNMSVKEIRKCNVKLPIETHLG